MNHILDIRIFKLILLSLKFTYNISEDFVAYLLFKTSLFQWVSFSTLFKRKHLLTFIQLHQDICQ